jgi:phage host-nuclease inhibitor protein Gam
MKKYILTKVVSAQPQSKDGVDSYKIVDEDESIVWEPKEKFEKHSFPLEEDIKRVLGGDVERMIKKHDTSEMGDKMIATSTTLINW